MTTKAVPQTEQEFLAAFVEYAELMGWKVHHVLEQRHYAKRIGPGFPDCVLVRDGRLVFAELKAEKGRLSDAQDQWFEELVFVEAECPETVQVYVWRPSDWPEIEATLGAGRVVQGA